VNALKDHQDLRKAECLFWSAEILNFVNHLVFLRAQFCLH
jgi:hypothetical protein